MASFPSSPMIFVDIGKFYFGVWNIYRILKIEFTLLIWGIWGVIDNGIVILIWHGNNEDLIEGLFWVFFFVSEWGFGCCFSVIN